MKARPQRLGGGGAWGWGVRGSRGGQAGSGWGGRLWSRSALSTRWRQMDVQGMRGMGVANGHGWGLRHPSGALTNVCYFSEEGREE